MWVSSKLSLFGILYSISLFTSVCSGQGGWRQWEIHMRDGTVFEANPLGINKKGMFTRSMSKTENGIERSRIAYLAASGGELPTLPSEKFKEDTIIMLDGSKTIGPIKFREIRFSEGTFIQNGREQTLENVAYIVLKPTKKK